jgi:glutathione S-transferase
MVKVDISGMSNLKAWLGRINARPSFAREQPAS